MEDRQNSGGEPVNYQECIHYLEEDVGFSSIPGLERIQYLCDLLGNPEQRLPVIHVAGTNGKGSAVAMLSSILKEAGYRVGAYTSPHLERKKTGPLTIIISPFAHFIKRRSKVPPTLLLTIFLP